MKIWWGFRLAIDTSLLYLFFQFFAMYPVFYYRFAKSEPIRWTQRRRQYLSNPYFSDPRTWKVAYNKKLEAIAPATP